MQQPRVRNLVPGKRVEAGPGQEPELSGVWKSAAYLVRLPTLSAWGGLVGLLEEGGQMNVEQYAGSLGLYVSTWSPGDGMTRYRFHAYPSDYNAGKELYTAGGLKDAKTWLRGYRQGQINAREALGTVNA